MSKPPVLFVSKLPQRWHPLFLEKFGEHYSLQTVYILDHVQKHGYVSFLEALNARIIESGVKLVLLDIEFFLGFGLDLILRIDRGVKIILVTLDDISCHEVNYINALGCDLVTCGDPIAVLKYREKNLLSELLLLENSRKIYDQFRGLAKDIDVLFFGDLSKGGRKTFIEALIANGIQVTVHSSDAHGELPYDQLARLISRAKLVLNLSKTHAAMGRPEAFVPVREFLQFKGRVVEAGLGGAVCVSEYAPAVEYMFGEEVVPMFASAEECAKLVRSLLADPERIRSLSSRLQQKVFESFEQEPQQKKLITVIDSMPVSTKVPPPWIPSRYVLAIASARFLTVKRPFLAWISDFRSFLFESRIYRLRLRLLATMVIFLEGVKRAFLKLRFPVDLRKYRLVSKPTR